MWRMLNIKYITFIYLLILLLGSILPLNSVSSPLNDNYTLHIRWDYLLHALIYIPLPVLLGLYFKNESWILPILFGLLFVVLFESLQLVIPYRAFNINDLMANGVGAIMGLIPAVLVLRYFSNSA